MHRKPQDIRRPARLDDVLADYMLRVDRGEQVDKESLIAGHPTLAADLRAYFSQAVDIERFAAGENIDTATFARDDSIRGRAQLAVRCPNCHAPAELDVDTPLTDVTCSSCGSQFSLINERDASQVTPPLATLGRFELIARLGMGAFGAVWKARDKELDRTVAIKIPRQGAMTAEEQEKFFREARAAAQLCHPNIVSVHEVGREGDSIYIVSDFVSGVTLRDWLTGQQLTSREAAELCAKIADALHHAHEKGVVHRDLKPANIMIDPDGQPHLMDFGLARREVGEVTVTLEGHILGTPAYMSPEQAKGESHNADRRSDVYSLGVILFQLLTGELPFRGNARMLMHQVIHDESPSPRQFNANVSKDLETITLKCLEKDPAGRYQTAFDFANESRRFLAGEPILARPIGRLSRSWRWAKRRPAAAAVLILLVVCAAGSAAAFFRERNLRREVVAQKNEAVARKGETEAVLGFVQEKILAAAGPEEDGGLGHNVTLRQAIGDAMQFVDSSFSEQPLIEARLRATLAWTFRYLEEVELAAEQFEKARMLYSRELGDDDPATLDTMHGLAISYVELGRIEEALKLRQECLARQIASLGPDHSATLRSRMNLAICYRALGRYEDAIRVHEETLTIRKAKLGADHRETLMSMMNLAFCYHECGRYADAMRLAEETLARQRVVLGPDHSDTLWCMSNLAMSYAELGRHNESLQLREEVFGYYKIKFGPDHPDTIWSMRRLADGYESVARHEKALNVREELFRLAKAKWGVDDAVTLGNANLLALSYEAVGQHEVALRLHEETLSLQNAKLGPEHADTIVSMNDLAWLLATSPMDEIRNGILAVDLATKACELSEYHNPSYVNTLAAACAETGDFEAAAKWSQKAIELLDEDDSRREKFSQAIANYQAKKPTRQVIVHNHTPRTN